MIKLVEVTLDTVRLLTPKGAETNTRIATFRAVRRVSQFHVNMMSLSKFCQKMLEKCTGAATHDRGYEIFYSPIERRREIVEYVAEQHKFIACLPQTIHTEGDISNCKRSTKGVANFEGDGCRQIVSSC